MYLRSIAAVLMFLVVMPFGCTLNDDDKVSDNNVGRRVQVDANQIEDAPKPRISPQTHLAAGRMLETQGDLRGAIDQYEKAVLANPRLTEAYNRLGIIYQKAGKFDIAAQMYRRGIEADPRSAMLHNNLGFCYLARNELGPAEQSLRQAVAVNPGFKRARMNLGIVLARAGRLNESVAVFEGVTTSDIANYNVGVICLDMGRLNDAENALKRALAINPECRGAQAYLDHARRLAQGDAPTELDPGQTATTLAGQLDDEPTIDVP